LASALLRISGAFSKLPTAFWEIPADAEDVAQEAFLRAYQKF